MISKPYLPLFINTMSPRFAVQETIFSGTPGLAAWPAANRALYVPIAVPWHYPVKRMFISIGASAGNIDLGIYNWNKTKVWSAGSTAMAGTNVNQFINTADIVLAPGWYYLAAVCSTITTATFGRSNTMSAATMKANGYCEEASALPLPTTMTIASVTTNYIALFGITRTASGYTG